MNSQLVPWAEVNVQAVRHARQRPASEWHCWYPDTGDSTRDELGQDNGSWERSQTGEHMARKTGSDSVSHSYIEGLLQLQSSVNWAEEETERLSVFVVTRAWWWKRRRWAASVSTCRTGRKTPSSEVSPQEVFTMHFAAGSVQQRCITCLLVRCPGMLKHVSLTQDMKIRLTNNTANEESQLTGPRLSQAFELVNRRICPI